MSVIFRLILPGILIISIAGNALAGARAFIKEYYYKASDLDSRISCRTIALEQVKKSLLEELGTYVTSETTVLNNVLTKDQVTSYSAGIVTTKVLDEKWDGNTYYIRATIAADPSDVANKIELMRKDKERARELEEAWKIANAATSELNKLKYGSTSRSDNATAKDKYEKAISAVVANEYYYQAFSKLDKGFYREAITMLNEVIKLNPTIAASYLNRGAAFRALGNYPLAIDDANRALELIPCYAKAHWLAGVSEHDQCFKTRGNPNSGMAEWGEIIRHYTEAIKCDPLYADAYYSLGILYINAEYGYYYNEGMHNIEIARKLGHK